MQKNIFNYEPFSLRRVGGKFSGPSVGKRAEALNFLDFFASFLGQAKNEEPARLEGILIDSYKKKIPVFLRCTSKTGMTTL